MKYLLTALLCAFIAASFTGRKCDHVFVEVEQPTIKIEQPEFNLGGRVYQEYSWPTGKLEGKDLICVKCFHQIKQVLDYGQPAKSTITWPPLGSTNCCDSIKVFNSGSGAVFFKKGSLQVDTTGIIGLMIKD